MGSCFAASVQEPPKCSYDPLIIDPVGDGPVEVFIVKKVRAGEPVVGEEDAPPVGECNTKGMVEIVFSNHDELS